MSAPNSPGPRTFHDVVCPFCGLLCDDLEVTRGPQGLRIARNGCPRAANGFERDVPSDQPRIDGVSADLEPAIIAAARLLRVARQPLIGGLGTDVSGMRALVALAERTGGILDHMHGAAIQRNVRTLQDRGWFMTTLTEVRNRADLLVLAGTDTAQDYPRFLERCLPSPRGLLGGKIGPRRVVVLGPRRPSALEPAAGVNVEHLRCDPARLGEVFAALRAALAGRSVQAAKIAGVAAARVADLAQALRDARYSVIAWAPEGLPDAQGEMAVENICALVKELNATTRSAGLSLGGNDGAATALSVCAWLTGYPLRTGFAPGYPQHHPSRHALADALADGEADALLWVTGFRPQAPPPTEVPTVVLAPPGAQHRREPEIFIPVGTPGLDHPGQLVRCDSVVTLPLERLRACPHPSVADVVTAIGQAL